jgi:arylsulfatase A-like enzyme
MVKTVKAAEMTLIHSLFYFLSSLGLVIACQAASADNQTKNIVLILADDLGWADTTLYGKTSFYETPNIERLAARGMTFSNAYASPICSPTRASIMTGQNPARHGMTAPAAHLADERFEATVSERGVPDQKCTNVKSATRLDPDLPTLGKVLHNVGYATAHFGKWHLGREPYSPLESGFDVDLPHWWGPGPKSSYLAPWGYANPQFKEGQPGEHIEDRMATEAVAWLKQRDRTKPFFLNYWQFSVHAPFGAKPELIEHYRNKLGASVDGLAKPEVRERLLSSHEPLIGLPQQSPTYAAMVHSLDDAVGSLLDALDAEGITDETVIIFYSDNGGNIHCGLEETAASGEKYITPVTSNHPLRGGKGGIHEGGVRVPAIVVWPGVTSPGSRNKTRIQAIDLYPTVLHMLGVESPKTAVIDGVNFIEALRGAEVERTPMFTYVPSHGNTPHWLPPSMSVHVGNWKLIRTFYYGEAGTHDYRLYNLQDDIGESHNLAAAHPEKVQELDGLIDSYIKEVGVVLPAVNPNFDSGVFHPEKIGVQAGGLKMPPASKASLKKTTGSSTDQQAPRKEILGWVAKNAKTSIKDGALKVVSIGKNSFVASAKIPARGPGVLRFRMRSPKNGKGQIQWRSKGQTSFPESGQMQSFLAEGAVWQEHEVGIEEKNGIVHLRLFMPQQKQPVEIDWIEISWQGDDEIKSQRWDF